MDILFQIVSITLVQVPAIVLRYLPFSSIITATQKKKLLLFYSFIFFVQHIILYALIKNNYIDITLLSYKRIIFIFSISYVVVNLYVIKKYLFQHLFIYGMQGGYSLFLHSIVAVIQSHLSDDLPLHEQLLIQTITYCILFTFITIPLWKHVGNSFIFKSTSTQEYYWHIIWLIPTIAVYSDAIVTMNDQWIHTWPQIVSRLLTALALFISWKCISMDFESLEKIRALKDMNKLLYIQKESILSQAERIDDNEKKIRIFKHDMRHHLQLLLSLLEHKNNAEAIELITQLNDTLHSTKPVIFCKNTVINAALLVYITKAQSENIEVVSDVDIPDDIPWNSNDIAILFANALENAVHASLKQQKENRCIHITTRYEDNKLAIRIQNRFDGKLQLGTSGFPTSNEPDHGIGTQSILAIAQKHKAHASCSHKDGWFCMSFLFIL